jgi:hypothetical protein
MVKLATMLRNAFSGSGPEAPAIKPAFDADVVAAQRLAEQAQQRLAALGAELQGARARVAQAEQAAAEALASGLPPEADALDAARRRVDALLADRVLAERAAAIASARVDEARRAGVALLVEWSYREMLALADELDELRAHVAEMAGRYATLRDESRSRQVALQSDSLLDLGGLDLDDLLVRALPLLTDLAGKLTLVAAFVDNRRHRESREADAEPEAAPPIRVDEDRGFRIVPPEALQRAAQDEEARRTAEISW